MDAFLSWWDGSLDEIAGIPNYWVVRGARIAQFVSGLAIVVEIVGKDRVEEATKPTVQYLRRLAEAQFLREVATGLWETSKYFLLYLLAPPGSEKEERYMALSNAAKYDTQAIMAWIALTVLGMGVLWVTIFWIWLDDLGLRSIWLFPVTLLGIFVISMLLSMPWP